MITALVSMLLVPVRAQIILPELQTYECGGWIIAFRQGEDRMTLNGRDLSIAWSDDGADGVTDDGHHLQIFKDGKVRLNDELCRDPSAL